MFSIEASLLFYVMIWPLTLFLISRRRIPFSVPPLGLSSDLQGSHSWFHFWSVGGRFCMAMMAGRYCVTIFIHRKLHPCPTPAPLHLDLASAAVSYVIRCNNYCTHCACNYSLHIRAWCRYLREIGNYKLLFHFVCVYMFSDKPAT